MIMEATKRRSLQDKAQPMIGNAGPQSTGLHHHHSMNNQMAPQVTQPPHSIAPHPGANRPPLERSHTFPTPPTSASSLITTQGSSYEWGNQNMSGSVQSSTQPLAIDTGLSNARSLPSTPATTPPGNAIHGLPGSYPSQQSYDNSRPMYSAAPQQQSQFATQQQNLARFGQPMQPNVYMKNDMGPPSRQTGSGAEGDPTDIKQDPYSHGHSNDQLGHGTGEEEAEHEHDTEYAHDNSAAYNANRGAYNYNTSSTIGSMHGEHPHLSPEQVNGSPHQNGSGRVTPRTSSVSQPQWNSGYNTPPRTAGSAGLYNVVSDTRGTATNGHSVSDNYSSSGYASTAVNGVTTSNKRAREDDDSDYKTRPGSGGDDIESLKRRKSGREDSLGNGPASFAHDGQGMNRNRATVIQRRRP